MKMKISVILVVFIISISFSCCFENTTKEEDELVLEGPFIYNDLIIWYSQSTFWIYNISTSEINEVKTELSDISTAYIDGNSVFLVEYQRSRNPKKFKLYTFNLLTEELKSLNIFGIKEYFRVHNNYGVAEVEDGVILFNLESESQISLSKSGFFPSVHNDLVIWWGKGGIVMYLYEISTGNISELDIGTKNQYVSPGFGGHRIIQPDIYNEKIVYVGMEHAYRGDDEDPINGQEDIYLYDLETKSDYQISNDSLFERSSEIYGDYIVWASYNTETNGKIFTHRLSRNKSTLFYESETSNTILRPKIYGKYITWIEVEDEERFHILYGDIEKEETYDIFH